MHDLLIQVKSETDPQFDFLPTWHQSNQDFLLVRLSCLEKRRNNTAGYSQDKQPQS